MIDHERRCLATKVEMMFFVLHFAVNIILHRSYNNKRHRVSEADEEVDEQAAQRAARAVKTRKNEPVPEGEALLVPRLTGKAVYSGGSSFGGVKSSPPKMSP